MISEKVTSGSAVKIMATAKSMLNIPRLMRIENVPMLIGQCVPCVKSNASKLKVKRLELDPNLLMYFYKHEFVYVTDPEKVCKTGDIVLAEKLPDMLTKLISHKILRIVHPLGDLTDPITGKKIVNSMFREDLEKETDLYGRLPSTFDYERAPPRGWQEGKKDLTDKEIYLRHHVYPEEDPYSI